MKIKVNLTDEQIDNLREKTKYMKPTERATMPCKIEIDGDEYNAIFEAIAIRGDWPIWERDAMGNPKRINNIIAVKNKIVIEDLAYETATKYCDIAKVEINGNSYYSGVSNHRTIPCNCGVNVRADLTFAER